MYSKHQPIISRYARACPENLARVMQFVIITAQTRLYNVPANVETAEQGGDEALGVLYGWKLAAYANAYINRERNYSYLEFTFAQEDWSIRERTEIMLEYVASLPGFGPAKAGFVLQLTYGLAGCMDTHNLKRFNMPLRVFDNYCQRKSIKGRRAKIALYLNTLEKIGTPEYLWDSWCIFVFEKYPSVYSDANHVSRVHCDALGL